MKQFLRRVRQFSMYRRIVISFLVITVVFAVAIAVMIYSIFNHTMLRELEYVENSSLLRAESALSQLYENAFSLSYSIWSLPQMSSILNSDTVDRVVEYRAFLELKKLQNAYPQIFGITVINDLDKRFFGTIGAGFLEEGSVLADLPGYWDRGMIVIRRRVPRNASVPSADEVDVISFVYRPTGRLVNNAIVLDVLADDIGRMIHFGTAAPMDETFILSDDGEVLVGNADMASLDFRYDALLADAPFSQYSWRLGRETYLFSRCDADIPGWNIVRVMPFVAQSAAATGFTRNLLLIVGALIVVSVALIVRMIRRLYNPIGQLVEDTHSVARMVSNVEELKVDELKAVHDTMEQYVTKAEMLKLYQDRASSFIEQQFVRFMLQGDVVSAQEALELMQVEVGFWENKRFTAVAMEIDGEEEYLRSYPAKDRSLHGFALSNVLSEYLGSMLVQGLVRMGGEIYCALLVYKGSFPVDAILALKECQKYMAQRFNLSMNIALGSSVDSWEAASDSYRIAVNRLKLSFYSQSGCLIDDTFSLELRENGDYPLRLVTRLRETIMQNNQDKTAEVTNAFFRAIEGIDPKYAKIYTERFVNDLFHEMAHHNIVMYPDHRIFTAIQQAGHMSELVDLVNEYILQFARRADERSTSRQGERDQPLLYAKEYIDTHYADPDLSVEKLADMVKLSPVYFGRQFSNMFRVSCTNYIIDVRMNRAAGMLIETNETVRAISEAVGIGTPNYFFLLFKKKYGMTPAQYRKQNSGLKPPESEER